MDVKDKEWNSRRVISDGWNYENDMLAIDKQRFKFWWYKRQKIFYDFGTYVFIY